MRPQELQIVPVALTEVVPGDFERERQAVVAREQNSCRVFYLDPLAGMQLGNDPVEARVVQHPQGEVEDLKTKIHERAAARAVTTVAPRGPNDPDLTIQPARLR